MRTDSLKLNFLLSFLTLSGTGAFAQGGMPLWTNQFGGSGGGLYDQPNALACDNNGNVIVTGYITAANGNPEMATINYSAAGLPLWTNILDGFSNYGSSGNAI